MESLFRFAGMMGCASAECRQEYYSGGGLTNGKDA